MPEVDLGDVEVFARVVDAGSFSGAAREMRAPKSSVSRRVARLEAALGVRLLQRTTRSLALTEVGRSYHERVSSALGELSDAASAAGDEREVPRGAVRLVAPADVGTEVLPAIVARFVAEYPEVRVDVDLSAEAPSLVRGRYDLALRAGAQRDASLRATRLQDTSFRLYAAPEYLARAGAPERAADLADHACLPVRDPAGAPSRWRLHGPGGDEELRVGGPIAASDLSFIRRATVAGAGIALLPELVARPLVAAGRLRTVLADHYARGHPLYLVQPASRHVPLRVRVLRDHLVAHFPA